jgi:hypothetical protein
MVRTEVSSRGCPAEHRNIDVADKGTSAAPVPLERVELDHRDVNLTSND